MELDLQASQDQLSEVISRINQGQDLFRRDDVVFLVEQVGYWARKYLDEAKEKHPELNSD